MAKANGLSEPSNVVVTDREFDKAESQFANANARDESIRFIRVPSDEDSLAAMIQQSAATVAIVGITPYRDRLYQALAANVAASNPNASNPIASKGSTAAVIRFGAGHDSIDKTAAAEAGVAVFNTPGTLDNAVAQWTIALMLSVTRGLQSAATTTASGLWQPSVGVELTGRHLVNVGVGGIGTRVAELARCMGMTVTGVGRRSPAQFAESGGGSLDEATAARGLDHYTEDLAAAVARADVVSLHLPGGPGNRHLFDAAMLARMKSTAVLINTARGGIVDENALFHSLQQGRITAAALDVFEHEPYQPIDRRCDLRSLPNCLMTPHTGSSTDRAVAAMAQRCIEHAQTVLAGMGETITDRVRSPACQT